MTVMWQLRGGIVGGLVDCRSRWWCRLTATLLDFIFAVLQSLFGKMMDTAEELEAAATAFRHQRLASVMTNRWGVGCWALSSCKLLAWVSGLCVMAWPPGRLLITWPLLMLTNLHIKQLCSASSSLGGVCELWLLVRGVLGISPAAKQPTRGWCQQQTWAQRVQSALPSAAECNSHFVWCGVPWTGVSL